MDIPPTLIQVGSSVVVGVAASYVTFRLQWAAFQGKDVEREKHWTKWRDGITGDVEDLKRAAGLPQLAALVQKVDDMAQRLAAIERRLFGGRNV